MIQTTIKPHPALGYSFANILIGERLKLSKQAEYENEAENKSKFDEKEAKIMKRANHVLSIILDPYYFCSFHSRFSEPWSVHCSLYILRTSAYDTAFTQFVRCPIYLAQPLHRP
jgi:hypothetical protein